MKLSLLAAATFGSLASAQGETNFSTWFPITEFPNAQTANVSKIQAEAQRLAGADLRQDYMHRCINAGQKYPEIGAARQIDGFIAPARPFDSLFFVGSSAVSAWAIDTGEGLIVIDALWNAEEAEEILIPGLESFGYTGEDIKALIISHEHIDHYGGALWLQETYGMSVYCSEECWEGMNEAGDGPVKNETLADGQEFTLGNTTIAMYITPGHTPGTLSMVIPLFDRGEPHKAGFYGGGGIPRSAEDKALQIESFGRFQEIAEEHGVDVLLSNHQTQDHSLQNFDELANRICEDAECSVDNPYVVGTEKYVRYLGVMAACVRLNAARQGQDLRV